MSVRCVALHEAIKAGRVVLPSVGVQETEEGPLTLINCPVCTSTLSVPDTRQQEPEKVDDLQGQV